MARIAFIGLGAMGSRMAAHLLEGNELVVHNRTRARADDLINRGATWADTPRDAAGGADVVLTMVTDDAAAESVWLDPKSGALAAMKEGALAMECSTVTPQWASRLASATSEVGVRLLDSPVAGSTPQAEAGKLAFIVGGADADVLEATPLMERMGAVVLHAGPQTHGSILKLVVNSLFATQVALIAELLAATEAQGLDVDRTMGLLAKMPVTSPAAVGAAGLMLAADHAPRFPTDLVLKDLGYAEALGEVPVVTAARARFEASASAGHGAKNLTAVRLVSGKASQA